MAWKLHGNGLALRHGDYFRFFVARDFQPSLKQAIACSYCSTALSVCKSLGAFTGIALSASLAGPLHAQEAAQDQNATTVLDTITVVSRTGETAMNTMASVSQIDDEEIERRMAVTPQDVFFATPGIAIQTDAKRAVSSINIRGLQDYGRVAVIVDGARQNAQRTGHGTQGLFFIDPLLIKQVDVVRGPVSNIYGSGAIGGVVFFETKDAGDFLLDGETYAGSLTGMYDTNAGGWTTSATGAYKFNEAADVIANLVWRDYGEYSDGNGDRVAASGFDLLSGMVKTTIRPTENSELKLGWVGTREGWTQLSSGLPTHDVDLEQNIFTARYNIKDDAESWLDLHINGSFSQSDLDQTSIREIQQYNSQGLPVDVPAGSRTTYDLNTYGLDIWNTSRFDTGSVSHELTYGGDWVSDKVTTTSPLGDSEPWTPSGNRTVWGAYIQEKLRYEWLEIVGGLRFDSYRLKSSEGGNSGNRLSPRLTIGISPFQNFQGLQFYGTYAEGYRSPSTTETLISGMHPDGVTFPFLPNPDLKPETARTWEAGVNYRHDGLFVARDSLRIKAAYFYNNIADYIELNAGIAAGSAGCTYMQDLSSVYTGGYYYPICAQYQNYASAKIHGFEFEAFYDMGRYFASLSTSIIDGYTTSYEGERGDLMTIPAAQVTLQAGMRAFENQLIFGGEVQYNSPPAGAVSGDEYTLVNLFASYQPTKNFRLDFRADNLFNVEYANVLNATTTTPILEQGLTLKLAATVRFGG